MLRKQYGKSRIVIITIIKEEFNAVQRLGNLTARCPGTEYYAQASNSNHEYDVVLCRADGWGNMAAGNAVTEAVEDFRPSYVVLVGIAGGIVRDKDRDPVKHGDVVIADFLHYSELKKLVASGVTHRYKAHDHPSLHLRLSFAEPLRSDAEANRWRSRIKAPAPTTPTLTKPTAHVDNLVSGETLYSNPDDPFQKHLLDDYYTAIAVDMESMGVGREICRQRRDPYYNPQFLIIRGISDLVIADHDPKRDVPAAGVSAESAAETNQNERNAWRVYAAEAAAAFALTLIEDLIESMGSIVTKAGSASDLEKSLK